MASEATLACTPPHTPHATGDEDCVARIAALENDFVAAKEGRHRVRVVHRPILEIDDAVERKGASDAGDRIDAYLFDMSVAREQFFDPLFTLERMPIGHVRVGVGHTFFEMRTSLRVKLDG
jgi:hypothetical protein